jgi:FkbM family methyltransferase
MAHPASHHHHQPQKEKRSVRSYLNKIRQDGLAAIIRRRLDGYSARLRFGNYWVGRAIELFGNRIRLGGMWFSLDSPAIPTRDKSTIALGGHEDAERRLCRWLPPELPVVEFGGAIGVTSCAVNRRLADPTRHIVFEPNPASKALLERNRDLNRCRFVVRQAALSYGSDTAVFGVHEDLFKSKLTEMGACREVISVPAITLANVLASEGWSECSLVADIEGAESLLIEHELETLRRNCRVLMLEIHQGELGQARCDEIVWLLERAGFRVLERMGRNWAFGRDELPVPSGPP